MHDDRIFVVNAVYLSYIIGYVWKRLPAHGEDDDDDQHELGHPPLVAQSFGAHLGTNLRHLDVISAEIFRISVLF